MVKISENSIKDGSTKTQIRVTEGYRPYPNVSPTQRTVKSFGYLEDQTDLEAFWKEVNACNDNLKHKWNLRIEIPVSEMMYSENNRLLNYYGLDSEFDLPDIYRALDRFNLVSYDLQRFISEHVVERFGRDLRYSFYDVTNYYTEKDFANPDEVYHDRSGNLGQKGVSKEHQLTPIIQMGMFMDRNGVPVCMDVFRGNISDSDTLKENLDEFKKEYDIERTMVVADKGMNCSHNIDLLCSQGDGYVFSQVLKGTKGKRCQKDLFTPEGWQEAAEWLLSLEADYGGVPGV